MRSFGVAAAAGWLVVAACRLPTIGGGAPVGAAVAASTCTAIPPRIEWPLSGRVSYDYAVIAYMDHDPSAGLRDFMGKVGASAITYDGHDGIDLDIGGFRRMDAGVRIYAGIDGEVIRAEDGAPDRNTDATAPEIKARANDVIVRHASGVTVAYWHLRRGSVRVRVGDRVTVGQQLAEVGSSGVSNGPHLHISAYGCRGEALDLMALGMFTNPPPYHPPRGLMRFDVLGDGGSPVDPPPRGSTAGQPVTFELVFAAVRAGDPVTLTATDQGGATLRLAVANDGPTMLPGFFWRPTITFAAGQWTLALHVGADLVDQRAWSVAPR